MTPFALVIYGNTEVRSIKDRLARGENPDVVLRDFNRNPTAILVNYITHAGKSLVRRMEICELAETL
jgi:hypothetical protein